VNDIHANLHTIVPMENNRSLDFQVQIRLWKFPGFETKRSMNVNVIHETDDMKYHVIREIRELHRRGGGFMVCI